MAPTPTKTQPHPPASKDSYLVIGGCGFLGSHIVSLLLARGELQVAILDLVRRGEVDSRVRFFSGDITREEQVVDAIKKTNASCIIHTASPTHEAKDTSLYHKINVEGTQCIINAALACSVSKLVFTSSAGVIYTGTNLIDADERLPYPSKGEIFDAYNESKAEAEKLVLKANGSKWSSAKGELKTVALRPATIFGPGDRQIMHHAEAAISKAHFQLGDNNNLFDYTYVTNIAHAHLLASDALSRITSPLPPTALTAIPLDPIELTTGSHRVPTSSARPVGPVVGAPSAADEKREKVFRERTKVGGVTVRKEGDMDIRPVLRTRYDPLSGPAIAAETEDEESGSPLQVAGQAFFITNGEPIYFWDFFRSIWSALGASPPPHSIIKSAPYPLPAGKSLLKIPESFAYPLATIVEYFGWITRRDITFSRVRVTYSTTTRWHNIEKARRVLGYEPIVGMEEGVRRMVEWWKEQKAQGAH